MALEEVKGAIIAEIDGREFDVIDLAVTERTGTKPVKTMNRNRRVTKFARGIQEFELRMTVVIPLAGDINWGAVEGAKITEYPVNENGKRISYLDCYTTEIGETYNVDNEARRDVSMFAARKIEE